MDEVLRSRWSGNWSRCLLPTAVGVGTCDAEGPGARRRAAPRRGRQARREFESKFVVSRQDGFSETGLPEIAFLGRSNVGKSSLINALTGQKRLAFTSNTPGRTQTINFYRIDGAFYFVDLPGYGYARVPPAIMAEWKNLIESYLQERETLKLACLILDARRGWMEKDLDLKRWLEHHGQPYLVVATKTDKLNQAGQERGMRAIREEGVDPLPFLAPKAGERGKFGKQSRRQSIRRKHPAGKKRKARREIARPIGNSGCRGKERRGKARRGFRETALRKARAAPPS